MFDLNKENQEIEKILETLSLDSLDTNSKQKVDHLLELNQSQDWSKPEIKTGTSEHSISVMFDDESKLYYCKGVTSVKVSPQEAALIFTQPRFTPMVNPMCKEINVLDESSEFARLRELKMIVRGYWPVNDRELVFKALCTWDKENRMAMNVNYYDEELEQRHSEVGPKRTRAILHIGGFIVKQIDCAPGERLSEVTYIVKIDPKGWIPRLAMKALSKAQINLLLNIKKKVRDDHETYKTGGEIDPLICKIFRLREFKPISAIETKVG